MAQYDSYEKEAGEFQELSPSFEENLVEALNNNIQLSVNKALAKALGPLTSHLKGFARHLGWLCPVAALSGSSSQLPKPSKVKAKAMNWAHSEAFEQLSAAVLEEHGYGNPHAQALSSEDSLRISELAGSDSSQDHSGSDRDEMPGHIKKRHPEYGLDLAQFHFMS
ncbi:hypothetical protein NDU88_003574 [Pleurodeles waltl]|uniref:Uncharacterized protein n=1 Tax=Pleurodeles waltl TaxID=8319 RepID=A0AAV7KVU8_PLEWA|nr:hypothetical protein NDU88_003574 [Pleurodeles waltl]